MRSRAYAIATTLLTLLGLACLLSLRFLGAYHHQTLALVLLFGFGWAVVSRVWLVRKDLLHKGLLRGLREPAGRPQLLQAVGRGSFWAAASVACLAVFPRSVEIVPVIGVLVVVSLLRVAASFLTSIRTNPGPTLVMVVGAVILTVDLGRAFIAAPAAVVRIAPPFEGEWLVLQGGQSPLQSHHLAAYNQRYALDLVRLRDGWISDGGAGNASIHSWEQPLLSPADGVVVHARNDMRDSEGANTTRDLEDAAGNVVVIEIESGHFVVLAHLRHGTLRVGEGDRVRKGDLLALVGNSGNTTIPHLHLQVQTHAELWDPDNRSVPFGFEPDGGVLARNDRVGAPVP